MAFLGLLSAAITNLHISTLYGADRRFFPGAGLHKLRAHFASAISSQKAFDTSLLVLPQSEKSAHHTLSRPGEAPASCAPRSFVSRGSFARQSRQARGEKSRNRPVFTLCANHVLTFLPDSRRKFFHDYRSDDPECRLTI